MVAMLFKYAIRFCIFDVEENQLHFSKLLSRWFGKGQWLKARRFLNILFHFYIFDIEEKFNFIYLLNYIQYVPCQST